MQSVSAECTCGVKLHNPQNICRGLEEEEEGEALVASGGVSSVIISRVRKSAADSAIYLNATEIIIRRRKKEI